jgi:hypothetical protein
MSSSCSFGGSTNPKAQVSDDDVRQSLNEPGGMTTAEVLAYLDEIDRTGKLRG